MAFEKVNTKLARQIAGGTVSQWLCPLLLVRHIGMMLRSNCTMAPSCDPRHTIPYGNKAAPCHAMPLPHQTELNDQSVTLTGSNARLGGGRFPQAETRGPALIKPSHTFFRRKIK